MNKTTVEIFQEIMQEIESKPLPTKEEFVVGQVASGGLARYNFKKGLATIHPNSPIEVPK